MQNDSVQSIETVIEPTASRGILNLRELSQYRDLFFFMVWRDIKALYAQSILGIGWAILNPVIQILIFTIIFGKVAGLETDGIPYVLFSTAAIIPWTYMSESMTRSSESLINGQHVLGKVYFPRVIFPVTPILAKLLDFAISLIVLLVVMLYYKVIPTWNLLMLPFFLIMMVAVPLGIGLWLSALAIRFRDVRFAMPFVVRMLIYTAPILYTASSIPDGYQFLYALNPIVGVIEGFRSCVLGTPFEWGFILPGAFMTIFLVYGGLAYFRRMETVFVDVI